jgi:hypothetical protein
MATGQQKLFRGAIVAAFLTLPIVGSTSRLIAAQADPIPAAEVKTTTRFSNPVTLPTPKGPVPLHVEVKDWYLAGHGRAVEISAQGFYIANLQSGDVVTQIGGKSEPRRPGDFWAVDKGVAMIVKVNGEGAILETFAISP